MTPDVDARPGGGGAGPKPGGGSGTKPGGGAGTSPQPSHPPSNPPPTKFTDVIPPKPGTPPSSPPRPPGAPPPPKGTHPFPQPVPDPYPSPKTRPSDGSLVEHSVKSTNRGGPTRSPTIASRPVGQAGHPYPRVAFDKGRNRRGDRWGPGGRYNPDGYGCGKKTAEFVAVAALALFAARKLFRT